MVSLLGRTDVRGVRYRVTDRHTQLLYHRCACAPRVITRAQARVNYCFNLHHTCANCTHVCSHSVTFWGLDLMIMMSLHVMWSPFSSLCSVIVRREHLVEWPEDLQQLMVDLHTSPHVTPTQSSIMNVVQRNGRNFLHVHIWTLD